MGHFVWSVHVRTDDAERVVHGVVEILTDCEFVARECDAAESGDAPAPARTNHVTEAQNGWVAIFDSNPTAAVALAGELARRLKTRVIYVFDNGSRWGYVLYGRDGLVDRMSSDGAADGYEIGELSPELSKLFAEGSAEEVREEIERRTADFQRRLSDLVPPHIRELHRRVTSGAATAEEAETYRAWSRSEVPKLADEMLTLSGDVFDVTDADSEGRSSDVRNAIDATIHVEFLRSLLVEGATGELAARVLEGRTEGAGLAEFLPLIGIAPDFATLEADDLAKMPPDGDSEPPGIRLRTELTFDRVSNS